MKKLFLATFIVAITRLIPLMGLSYESHSLGIGKLAGSKSFYVNGLAHKEYVANGGSEILQFIEDPEEFEESCFEILYPHLYSKDDEYQVKKLSLPTLKTVRYWDFKDKYILGTIYLDDSSSGDWCPIFLYDIHEDKLIDIAELAKKQGVTMHDFVDEIGSELTLNDSGVLVGAYGNDPVKSFDESRRIFAYYPELGLKIIDIEELGPNQTHSDCEDIHLNNKGQFVFEAYGNNTSSTYLYDPTEGVVELKDLENQMLSLCDIDNFWGGKPWDIISLNDKGDLLIELGYKTLYLYNIHTETLTRIISHNDRSDYFKFNNQGDVIYRVTMREDYIVEEEEYIWNAEYGPQKLPGFHIGGIDDFGRVFGEDSHGFLIWTRDNGVQYINDMLDSPLDPEQIIDYVVHKNGTVLINYYDDQIDEDTIIFLTPNE